MIYVTTSPTHISMLRKFNTWYSVKDGNWFDKNIWRGNGCKKYTYPQPGDDVHIDHDITFDYTNNPNAPSISRSSIVGNTIHNLYISKNGAYRTTNLGNQVTIFITGNVQCDGVFDLSNGSSGGGQLIDIGGNANWFNTFLAGNSSASSIIRYSSKTSFVIPPVNYYSLNIATESYNWLGADLTCNGLLTVESKAQLELDVYNVNVGDLNIQGKLTKVSSTGTFTVTAGASIFPSFANGGTVLFSGSPTINWSGNIVTDTRTGVNFGTGTLNILTNCNMTLSAGGNPPTNIGTLSVVIAVGKTLTVNGPSAWLNSGSVTGASSTSTLNISSGYAYANTTAIMPVGIFNYNFSGSSTIWFNAAMTLQQTSYYNLIINAAGVTVGANTTVSNAFTTNFAFNFSTYNFSIGGASIFNADVTCSGSGILSFKAITTSNKVDFSAGNPTVSIGGNLTGDFRNGFNLGSNTVNLTANASWGIWTSSNLEGPITANFLIGSGVTIINNGQAAGGGVATGGVKITGTIDGVDGTSSFINKNSFVCLSSTAPMTTGTFDTSTTLNTVTYGAAGNQDVHAGTYRNLTLNGSGAKKLLGNVSVINTYTLTGPATLNSNGFVLSNP